MQRGLKAFVAVMCVVLGERVLAASASNGHVTISCEIPRAQVSVDGNRFDVYAPGYEDSFVADVFVTANGEWMLVEPTAAKLPLRMKGGDVDTYTVFRPLECGDGGTIKFHNYYIFSDCADGAKDITVGFGENVTYKAHKNGSSCASDWTVNGQMQRDTSRIVFNRSWWDVPSWFYPSVDTPQPDKYNINAHDAQRAVLQDSGAMIVAGIKKISGPNGKASERAETPTEDVAWLETEVIYAQPRSVFNLTAELEPELTESEIDEIKSSVEWSVNSGRITPIAGNPLVAECCAPDDVGTYEVEVSCGESRRIILVKVGVYKIHQVSFLDNIVIKKDSNGVAYSGPAWKDEDLDGISDLTDANADASKSYQPVAYLSTKSLSAEGLFLPSCTKVSNPGEYIPEFDAEAVVQKLRFAPNDRWFGWDWSAPVAFNKNGTRVTAANPFRASAEVGYESVYELAWEVGFGELGTAIDDLSWHISRSQHELYLTYKAERSSYETVFHLGCVGADGETTDQGVVDGVWRNFSGKSVRRKDGISLTYYASYTNTVTNCKDLLSTHDGQCMAWADLLVEATRKIHGVGARIVTCRALYGSGFCVKRWSFVGRGTSGNDQFPYRNTPCRNGFVLETSYNWDEGSEVEYVSGVRGQNNDKPASMFARHFCVRFDGVQALFDPSYGLMHLTHTSMDDLMSAYYSRDSNGDYLFSKNPDGTQIGEIR